MPEIELELLRKEPLGLKYALLVYGNRSEVAITKNEIKDGQVGVGKPVDTASVIEEFNRNLAAVPGDDDDEFTDKRTAIGALTPALPTMLADNSAYRVWYTPPQLKKLFVGGKPKKCWLPLLIWIGHRREKRLFMLSAKGKCRPTDKTVVYRPRFGPLEGGLNHIHKNCAVCLGTMNPGRCTPKEWMDAFYDTNFKTADGLPAKPYEIPKEHIKLGAYATAIAKLSSSRFAD